MTEAELLQALEVAEKELRSLRFDLNKAERDLADSERFTERQTVIQNANLEALKSLVTCPIILLDEYRSLLAGLRETRKAMVKTRSEKPQLQAKRNKLFLQFQKMEKVIQDYRMRLGQKDFQEECKLLEFRVK